MSAEGFARLGVYSDLVYRTRGGRISTNRSFIRFVTSLPPRVDEVVVLGRLDPVEGTAPYVLPDDRVRFVPLPYYPRVWALPELARAIRGSCSAFWAELGRLDAVWIFGPHPLAVVFAVMARRRGVPVFLGVRQDYPRYVAGRLPRPTWAWCWAILAAHALEHSFRLISRGAPTVALGGEVARNYSRASRVLTTGFSLVRGEDVVSEEQALAKTWNSGRRLLSVGRLEPEKNPMLLLEVIERLRSRDSRWRLTIAGEGRLRPVLDAAVSARGLQEVVELVGEVENGAPLWDLYRRSDAFLHVSLTEGLPQVLVEAQAAGLPIVATAVGGVAEALGGGADALLIPPADVDAAAAALERLAAEPDLRRRLILAGIENARRETLESQLDRLTAFFGEAAPVPRPRGRGASARPR